MITGADQATSAASFGLLSNLLTVIAVFGWLKFADAREGCLDRPNIHHRVWLRVLVTLSCVSILLALLGAGLSVGLLPF